MTTTAIPPSGLRSDGPEVFLQPGSGRSQRPSSDRGSRRLSWVLVGILLVAGSILVFVLVTLAGNERAPILVAGVEIEAGSIIEVSDVVVVQVAADTGVDFVSRAERDLVVGQRARTAISAGTPLSPELIVEEDRLADGQAIVGAVLSAGEYPASAISLGDTVTLLDVGTQGSDDPAVEISRATIWAIEPVADQSEPRFFISFAVELEFQLDVATAAGRDRLRVSLVDES
ncbi:MAG: hypothetical protein GY926_13590 [bacterium]|nr:hypothetical protein [bacterium]